MLSKALLQKGLNTKFIGKKLFVFETIDSTNSCAKILADAGIEEGSIVIANYQTDGRGRLGRTWHSDKDKNLLFSIIVKPPLHRSKISLLSFYASVAVAQGIESCTGITVECKWPNDILLNRKKCCGILVETSAGPDIVKYAVIGVGINVNQELFDSDFLQPATSLKLFIGKEIDRVLLFQHIIKTFDNLYFAVQKSDFRVILEEWMKHSTMFGKTITIYQHNFSYKATAEKLNSDGSLLVRTPNGLQVLYAGDVTIRLHDD